MVDTGPLVALGDVDDRFHGVCTELLATHVGPLVTTPLVVAEAGYMLSRGLGANAELALLAMILDRTLIVESPTQADWTRVHELINSYEDLKLGVTDGSVIAISERLGIEDVATLDRRHFTVVRPRHLSAFRLLPELT
jgi:uncharacterized protein